MIIFGRLGFADRTLMQKNYCAHVLWSQHVLKLDNQKLTGFYMFYLKKIFLVKYAKGIFFPHP